MTDKNSISQEKVLPIHQSAMAEALGAVSIGDSIEPIDTNIKSFGFDHADNVAESKSDEYDMSHPIVPNTHLVEPSPVSLVDILKNDGVGGFVKSVVAPVIQKTPKQVLASAQRRHPEESSKPEPAFDEMWIDGIMKRVPRN